MTDASAPYISTWRVYTSRTPSPARPLLDRHFLALVERALLRAREFRSSISLSYLDDVSYRPPSNVDNIPKIQFSLNGDSSDQKDLERFLEVEVERQGEKYHASFPTR